MRIIVFVFLFCLMPVGQALTVKILNKNKTKIESFTAGDYLNVYIEIHPRSEIGNIENLTKQLEEKKLGPFKIVKISDLKASENNAEVILIDSELALTEALPAEQLGIRINGNFIPFDFENLEYIYKDLKPNLVIFDQAVNKQYKKQYWLILIISLIVMALVFALVKILRSRKAKVNPELDYNKAFELLHNCRTRQDLELLYKEKDVWAGFVNKRVVKEYFAVLNKHQYKPEWKESDLAEVLESYQKIEMNNNDL